jgi:hypothetical protein
VLLEALLAADSAVKQCTALVIAQVACPTAKPSHERTAQRLQVRRPRVLGDTAYLGSDVLPVELAHPVDVPWWVLYCLLVQCMSV